MSKQRAKPACAAQPGTRLIVMDAYGMSSIEGIIVGGAKDEDETWNLDSRLNGWCCLIEVEKESGEGRGELTDAG